MAAVGGGGGEGGGGTRRWLRNVIGKKGKLLPHQGPATTPVRRPAVLLRYKVEAPQVLKDGERSPQSGTEMGEDEPQKPQSAPKINEHGQDAWRSTDIPVLLGAFEHACSPPQTLAAQGQGGSPVVRMLPVDPGLTSMTPNREELPEYDIVGSEEVIGIGACGTVVKVRQGNGSVLAVKLIYIGPANERGSREREALEAAKREVNTLSEIMHPNIVRYYGWKEAGDFLHIVMEYLPAGSIEKELRTFHPSGFDETAVQRYTRLLLEAVNCMHGVNIMHRDIKGANILLDKQWNGTVIKLADFGASKAVNSQVKHRTLLGTVPFMAPEVLRQVGADCRADIWSIGCTVIEMATGNPPSYQGVNRSGLNFYAIGKRIFSEDDCPEIPEHLSPECKDFLQRCFRRNPQERPTAEELLQHPFLMNLQFSSQHNAQILQPQPQLQEQDLSHGRRSEPGSISDTDEVNMGSLAGEIRAPATEGLTGQPPLAATSGRNEQHVLDGSMRVDACIGDINSMHYWLECICQSQGIDSFVKTLLEELKLRSASNLAAAGLLGVAQSDEGRRALQQQLDLLRLAVEQRPNDILSSILQHLDSYLMRLSASEEPVEAVPIEGVNNRIMDFVDTLHHGTPNSKEVAAGALADLLGEDSCSAVGIVLAGAIPQLIALVRGGANNVKEQAARALSELARSVQEGVNSRVLIRKAGGIPPLAWAARALGNVARDDDAKRLIREEGGIPPLVALLTSGTDDGKAWAAHALGNVAFDKDAKRLIREASGIPPLVALLTSGTNDGKAWAARALGNVALDDDAERLILEEGGIPPLIALLTSGTDKGKAWAAYALGTVAFDNDAERLIREASGIPPLVALLTSGTDDGKDWAAYALGTVALNFDANRLIREASGIPPLVALLTSGTDKGKAWAARALGNVALDNDAKRLIREEGAIRLLDELN
eukprot:jgi/Chlat1/7328/Chrsp59S06965